jgi:hypothetical protein
MNPICSLINSPLLLPLLDRRYRFGVSCNKVASTGLRRRKFDFSVGEKRHGDVNI